MNLSSIIKQTILGTAVYFATPYEAHCPNTNIHINMHETFGQGESFVDKLLDYEERYGVENVDDARKYWDSLINVIRPALAPRYEEYFTDSIARNVAKGIDSILLMEKYTYFKKSTLITETLNNKAMNCATIAIIYHSIGQELELPTRLVRGSGHLFIRWELTNSGYINWEPQPQAKIKDRPNEHYIERKHIVPQALQKGAYLKTLNEKETLSLLHERIAYMILYQSRTISHSLDSKEIKKKKAKEWLLHQEYHNEQALSLDRDNITATCNLASAQRMLGKHAMAHTNYKRALELDPTQRVALMMEKEYTDQHRIIEQLQREKDSIQNQQEIRTIVEFFRQPGKYQSDAERIRAR